MNINVKNLKGYLKIPTAVIIAGVTFVLGFIGGVGLTVYKTGSIGPAKTIQESDGEKEKMRQAVEAETNRNPNNVKAWIQLGNLYFDSNHYAKAITAYEHAIELDQKNPDVLTDLAIMYRRSGQPDKAIEAFDKAIAVDPKHEASRFNKGIVLMHDLKDQDSAIQAWEELLEINPLAMAGKNQSVDQLVNHYKEGHDKNTPN